VLGPRRDDGWVGNYYSPNLRWLQAECADGLVFAEEMRLSCLLHRQCETLQVTLYLTGVCAVCVWNRVRADRSLGGLLVSCETEHRGGWEGGLSV
jgi:hypothetical protein